MIGLSFLEEIVDGLDRRFDVHGVLFHVVEDQPGNPVAGRRAPGGIMAVDFRLQHLAGTVGADDFHGQVVVSHLREQGGHLQQFERILAECEGDIGIDLALVVFHDVLRTGSQVISMLGEIPGGNHFLLQVVVQPVDVLHVGVQLRADQFHRRLHGLAVDRAVDDSLHGERNRDTDHDGEQFVQEIDDPLFDCKTLCHGEGA